jgi:hypothetical protein
MFGVATLVFVAALALALHNWVSRLLRRLVPARSTFATSLLTSARRVTRYALAVLALALVLPIAAQQRSDRNHRQASSHALPRRRASVPLHDGGDDAAGATRRMRAPSDAPEKAREPAAVCGASRY